jgi:hypothetical protein
MGSASSMITNIAQTRRLRVAFRVISARQAQVFTFTSSFTSPTHSGPAMTAVLSPKDLLRKENIMAQLDDDHIA